MSIMFEFGSFETHSTAETEALGARFARTLNVPAIVLLSGELGAGKTAFVRGMARGIDAPPGVRVTSPTYVLLHSYKAGRATLHHIDAYRLAGGADEFEDSGLSECLHDTNAITCIEWPEKIPALNFPCRPVRVRLEHLDPDSRKIDISGA